MSTGVDGEEAKLWEGDLMEGGLAMTSKAGGACTCRDCTTFEVSPTTCNGYDYNGYHS